MTQKKLAIFVEGQTEQVFIKRLITEIAGLKNVAFECKTNSGGVLGPTVWMQQSVDENNNSAAIYTVLLIDCMGDEKVKSTLLDQRASLVKSGYSLILGLRDLHPKPLADLQKIKLRLDYGVPTAGTPTYMLLTVSEIEAWFLQEHLHYQKIHSNLDPKTFPSTFNFDPINDSAETVQLAADLLDEIYKSVGLRYKKNRKHVQRTVGALDFGEMYFNLQDKLPHFRDFITHLDGFLVGQ